MISTLFAVTLLSLIDLEYGFERVGAFRSFRPELKGLYNSGSHWDGASNYGSNTGNTNSGTSNFGTTGGYNSGSYWDTASNYGGNTGNSGNSNYNSNYGNAGSASNYGSNTGNTGNSNYNSNYGSASNYGSNTGNTGNSNYNSNYGSASNYYQPKRYQPRQRQRQQQQRFNIQQQYNRIEPKRYQPRVERFQREPQRQPQRIRNFVAGDCFEQECAYVINNCAAHADCNTALGRTENEACDNGLDCSNGDIMCAQSFGDINACKALWNDVVQCYDNHVCEPAVINNNNNGDNGVSCVVQSCPNEANQCSNNPACAYAIQFADNGGCNSNDCSNSDAICNGDATCMQIWDLVVNCYNTNCASSQTTVRLAKQRQSYFRRQSTLRNRQYM